MTNTIILISIYLLLTSQSWSLTSDTESQAAVHMWLDELDESYRDLEFFDSCDIYLLYLLYSTHVPR